MSGLILHVRVKSAIRATIAAKPHAVLVTGPIGAGKRTVALHIAEQLLGARPEASPFFTEVSPDGNSISINQIRELRRFMRLKTTGDSPVRRAAVIVQADTMTTEAQNALLKLLEEPPADTVLLLTATHAELLLPTIRSRSQELYVHAPSLSAAKSYFNQDSQAVDKAYALSGGQVGLMVALLDEPEHTLVGFIEQAKNIYQLSTYDRLLLVDSLAKQKDDVPYLLYACKRIALSALESAAAKNQMSAIKAWHTRLNHITQAEQSLVHNPNAKLLLTDLFINL